MKWLRLVLSLLIVATACGAARAQSATYESDIRPILEEHCFNCHNPDKSKSGLDLTEHESLMAGSEDGPIVDADGENPGKSPLYLVVAHKDKPHMPPEEPKIPAEKIELIKKWIEAGAPKKRKITYADHVKPIFREHCFDCHNPQDREADLNLARYNGVMSGSSSGAVIERGRPGSSKLYLAVAHKAKPYMPRNRPQIPDAQISTIGAWIRGGALKNKDSKAPEIDKPKLDLALDRSAGKPEGEPVMPGDLLMDPIVRADRAAAPTALAHSPWAPLLAVGAQRQILLYNTDELALEGVVPFDEGRPHQLRFTRTGRYLLAAGGTGAKTGLAALYDVKTGERITAVGEAYDTLLTADINPAQSLIATGGPSKLVKVYRSETGELAYKIDKHTEWITALAFSPDGVLLATADRNGGLHVWEGPTGRNFYNLDGHGNAITAVSWRPDANAFLSAGEGGTIKLWNMKNGNQLKRWGAHNGGVLDARFTKDGRIVSAGRDHTVKLWKPNGQRIRQITGFDDITTHAAFNHGGTRVLAADYSGTFGVWDAENGKRLGSLTTNPPTVADRLAAAEKQKKKLQKEHGDPAQALQETSQRISKLQDRIASAKKQRDELQSVISRNSKSAKQADQRINGLAKQLKKARNALKEAEKTLEQRRKAVRSAEKKLKRIESQEKPDKGKREAAEKKLEKAGQSAANAEQTVDEARKETEQLRTRRDQAIKKRDNARQAVSEARKKLKKAEGSLASQQKQRKRADQKLERLKKARKTLKATKERIARWKREKKRAELFDFRRKLKRAKAERDRLSDALATADSDAARKKTQQKLEVVKKQVRRLENRVRLMSAWQKHAQQE